jgi:hypothetical protein
MVGGGGRKILARKMIYRKINFYENHMHTSFIVKRGRWVYERGGLEQDSKSPRGHYSVLRHNNMVSRDCYGVYTL